VGPPGKLQAASARARKSEKVSSGWARPKNFYIYTNRHPQPPAKCIGLNGISQEHYCRTLKINMLTAPGLWDIVG